jgi:molybdate transport system ATP-binding protein
VILEVDAMIRRGDRDVAVRLEARGDVTALIGPSGAGKSSALHAIAGLVRPERGRVVLGGRVLFDGTVDLPPHERGIGLVPQDALLFPHRSVLANLRYGAPRAGATAPTLDEVVAALDLGPLLERLPATLSGGERQRVALGRALCSGPRALLLDEALASLDGPRRARALDLVRGLRGRVATVLVTHALGEVLGCADRVVVLDAGVVVASGPPREVLAAPRDPRLSRLTGFDALIEVVVADHDEEDGTTRALLGPHPIVVPRVPLAAGARVTFGLRARDVLLATERPRGLSARNVVPGTVVDVLRDADGILVRLDVDEATATLVARIVPSAARDLGVEVGRRLMAILKTTALQPFHS